MPRFTFAQLLELTPENRLFTLSTSKQHRRSNWRLYALLNSTSAESWGGGGKKKSSFVTQTLPKALGNEIIKEGSSAVHVSYQTVYCFLHNSS